MRFEPTPTRELLQYALPTSFDADTQQLDASRLFTPDTHRLALDPDVTLVRGGRGVGKTVWFSSLQDQSLRRLVSDQYRLGAGLSEATVSAGYGTRLSPDEYPTPSAIQRLLSLSSPATMWRAVCLVALRDPIVFELGDWVLRCAYLDNDPEYFDVTVARIDRHAPARKLILFDALDRLSPTAGASAHLIQALLELALFLRTSTRSIRAKVFARPDLISELRFVDASKLTANAIDLRWTAANLYGLLFSLLGNAPDGAAFREASASDWTEVSPEVWRSPSLSGDRERQADVFKAMAGPYMGTNHRRGRTYPWLPDHLSDGKGLASPRSFLSALRAAVDDTINNRSGYELPIHFESIKRGVQRASQIRVDELAEDIPWVTKAIRPLAGMSVPVSEDDVLQRWESVLDAGELAPISIASDESVRVGPPNAENHRDLIRNLEELGVMTRRVDGRLDIPDVYRVAFDIGRRGGVPRPTPS